MGINEKGKEGVPINKIHLVEKKCNLGIHIIGDYTYEPTKNYQQNIYLILKDGHYSINYKAPCNFRVMRYATEKSVVVYYSNKKSFQICVNGEISDSSIEELNKYSNKEYIKLNRKWSVKAWKTDEEKTLLKCYQWVINQFDLLKKYSNDKINMYKTGWI